MTTSATPLDIPGLLRKNGLRPDKSLGQNFLQDPSALEQIARAAQIEPQDDVLEIGPGLGSLTRYLAEAARSVTAVELDSGLLPVLKTVVASYPNVRVVEGDILRLAPADLISGGEYLVVANVPYYITSAIFRHLLAQPLRPRRIVLTIQAEVAERICALPGDLSLLALSIQVYGRPAIVAGIPAEAFYPTPKVDSAVIRIDLYSQPVIPEDRLDRFFRLAKAGFSQKRKTLRNSLSAGLAISTQSAGQLLEQAGIDPQRRAETLNLDEWGRLSSL
jgi:16S rRNA (adenine1518-N6/adenine1519-N6)-dimethyltransferase